MPLSQGHCIRFCQAGSITSQLFLFSHVRHVLCEGDLLCLEAYLVHILCEEFSLSLPFWSWRDLSSLPHITFSTAIKICIWWITQLFVGHSKKLQSKRRGSRLWFCTLTLFLVYLFECNSVSCILRVPSKVGLFVGVLPDAFYNRQQHYWWCRDNGKCDCIQHNTTGGIFSWSKHPQFHKHLSCNAKIYYVWNTGYWPFGHVI